MTRAPTDALQLRDGAGELSLEGAHIVRPLDEIGKAELALVENFKTHAIAAGDAFRREIHAELIYLVAGDHDGRAARGDLVRYILRLEITDHRRRVLFTQPRVEQLHVRALGPDHHRGEAAHDRDGGDNE